MPAFSGTAQHSASFPSSFIFANDGAAVDTIRILVATDSHVGYEERDPIRKDDSWKSFHEVMCLAKSEDVSISLQH
jgi:hypothetical protein